MKAIELISIPVKDQERAKDFYLKLGFDLLVETPFGDHSKWIQMGLPGREPSITLVNWFDAMPPGCIQGLVISTDDIAAEIERLKTMGIEAGSIDETPWGKFATVKDPDGNALSLHQK